MTSFRLAWLHLSRTLFSSAVAVIALAVSVGCAGVLLRLYCLSQSRFASIATGPDAVIGAKAGGIEILLGSLNLEGDYPDFLPEALYQTLKAKTKVQFSDGADVSNEALRDILPLLFFAKAGPRSDPWAKVVATDEHFLTAVPDAKPLSEGSWSSELGNCVVGSFVAKSFPLHLKDTFEARLWLAPTANMPSVAIGLTTAGILKETGSAWDRGIYCNQATGEQALIARGPIPSSIWGTHVLNYFLLYLRPDGFKPLQDLINKRSVGQLIDVAAERAKLLELTGSGQSLGIFITVMIILLAGLCMLTLMLGRFDAMSTQIAVLRAIGYSQSAVGLWLIFEGSMIGVCGCIIGALLDALFFPLLRGLLGTTLPDESIVQASLLLSYPVWIAAILASLVALLLPLWKMHRQDIHSSLKG